MKYHKQEHLVTSDNPIKRGSCYPTVYACLLDKELHEVPYFHLAYWTQEERDNLTKAFEKRFCDGNYNTADENSRSNFTHYISLMLNHWDTTRYFWLASQGYTEEWVKKEDFHKWILVNPTTPYMVSGKSSRGVDHVVIYMNETLLHDPHPSNEGLVSFKEEPYNILVKI